MNLWIKNGHVLDPANHLDEVCDVYVKEERLPVLAAFRRIKFQTNVR